MCTERGRQGDRGLTKIRSNLDNLVVQLRVSSIRMHGSIELPKERDNLAVSHVLRDTAKDVVREGSSQVCCVALHAAHGLEPGGAEPEWASLDGIEPARFEKS